MPLQRSGIEYIAKGVGKFISDVNKANKALDKQASAAEKAANAVSKSGKASDVAAGGAAKFAGSTSKVTSGLGSLAGKLPSLTSLLGGAGLAGVLTLAGNAAIQFGNDSLESFKQFETAAAEVFTLLPGLSEQGMGALTDDIQKFSLESGRTTDTVIPALYQALSAGVPQGNVFDFLETALAASKGGVTDLETSVDALTSIMNAYNLEADSAGRVSDALFTAVRLGKTTFGELGSSIFNVTPTAAALGIEIETVSAALAALTAAGVPTSVATTQLRSLFDELAKSGSKSAAEFEAISGTTFPKFIENGGSVQEALGLMKDRADQLDTPLKNLFSSTEAGSAALLLATTGADNFASALVEMESSAGATEAAAAQFAGTLQEAENRANAASEAFRLAGGEALAPLKKSFLEAKTSALEFLVAWQQTSNAINANRSEANEAAGELRNLGDEGKRAAVAIEGELRKAFGQFSQEDNFAIKAAANAKALQLLQNGFKGTAAEAAAAAVEFAKIGLIDLNERGQQGRGGRASALQAEANAISEVVDATLDAGDAAEAAAAKQKEYDTALKAAQDVEKERAGISKLTAKALKEENITREDAIAILTKQYGNESRAANVLDQELQAIENVNGGLNTYIERNRVAAEAVALLDSQISELRASLASISADAFDSASNIISDLVSADNDQDVQAQIAKLQENRRTLVTDLISESSDLTFDQEIDLQLAFGEISLEEAELLRVEQQFFETVNSLFGAESVIELGDRAVSIGSLIVQNAGPEVAAQITDQIEALVTSGQGSAVDAAIEIVPQLVANGTIGEDAVGDFVTSLLGSIGDGASVSQAVEIAIATTVPNEDEARAAIEGLKASADALVGDGYDVDVTTNSGDAQTEIENATAAAQDLDGADPDVDINTNAGDAQGEIDAVREAVNNIKTEVVVNIRANRIGDFTGSSGPGGQAGFTEFMKGGFTGGTEGKFAGSVHGQELVIPANVLRDGPQAALAFALQNVPFYETPATQNYSNTVTNISNVTNNNVDQSRSLQTGNIGSERSFDRARHALLGDML